MKNTTQTANRLREVILNGTWIANTNFKDQLTDTTWELATTKIGDLNTIALLTFHIHYYIAGLLQVLEGGSLDIRDKYSFDMPSLQSQEDWNCMSKSVFGICCWQDLDLLLNHKGPTFVSFVVK